MIGIMAWLGVAGSRVGRRDDARFLPVTPRETTRQPATGSGTRYDHSRMPASIELRIDDEVAARLSTLEVTAVAFTGLRMGTPTRKIEPLRDRVIAAARERINEARDVRRIPTLAALHRAFPEVLRGQKRAWLDEAFRAIARRDPFPVVNDAVDVAKLLALHFAVPVSALDSSRLSSPLLLRMAPPGTRVKTPGGLDADASDLPLLTDVGGPVSSPFLDVARAMPTRQTSNVLLVVYDPKVDGGVDAAALRERAANWLGTLTGARPVT
jgi:DNA/RNA-binding domain of Phe-tRNA-synthetase-like protein